MNLRVNEVMQHGDGSVARTGTCQQELGGLMMLMMMMMMMMLMMMMMMLMTRKKRKMVLMMWVQAGSRRQRLQLPQWPSHVCYFTRALLHTCVIVTIASRATTTPNKGVTLNIAPP